MCSISVVCSQSEKGFAIAPCIIQLTHWIRNHHRSNSSLIPPVFGKLAENPLFRCLTTKSVAENLKLMAIKPDPAKAINGLPIPCGSRICSCQFSGVFGRDFLGSFGGRGATLRRDLLLLFPRSLFAPRGLRRRGWLRFREDSAL
jgi:hypothetical protein